MGISFETCLRRRRDGLMGRRCYVLSRRCHDVPIKCRGNVLLRCLGEVPPRRRWVFHLRQTCDFAGTYRETSLRRRYDVLLPGRFIVFKKIQTTCSDLLEKAFATSSKHLICVHKQNSIFLLV